MGRRRVSLSVRSERGWVSAWLAHGWCGGWLVVIGVGSEWDRQGYWDDQVDRVAPVGLGDARWVDGNESG